MNKVWMIAMAALSAATAGIPAQASDAASCDALSPVCKAAYLCDADSGTVVYTKEEEKRLPIASMCKIMTLTLCFEAAESGNLAWDEMITVSENASGMGGSQVFLDAGLSYTAEALVKTVAVCSANDSCVALAERIAGSEEGFVAMMNKRAAELGATNTLFANCTGLPKDPQYSCAKDVALMLRALTSHEKYFELCKVWLEDFPHPDGRTTSITNTNKLIRSYRGCDGGKTGFTNEAGFCLAATAKRDDMRLVAVVIGADSSQQRFSDISSMFDYAFATYESKPLLPRGELDLKAAVAGSKKKEISVVAESPLTYFCKRSEKGDYAVDIQISDLRAPVAAGAEVGFAALHVGGVEVKRVTLRAGEDAPALSWWDALRETARKWQ